VTQTPPPAGSDAGSSADVAGTAGKPHVHKPSTPKRPTTTTAKKPPDQQGSGDDFSNSRY
jgi:hypothetical protein